MPWLCWAQLFKRINDTWGHLAGDAILGELGKRLRSTLRQRDFVGRYGGEEFAVVLVDVDRDQAQQAAERMRAAVADQPYFWEVEETQSVVPIAVTASIGVAVYQLHGKSREALIEAADRAMYQAKHSGRNRVCLPDIENTLVQEESSIGTSDEDAKKEGTTVQALAHRFPQFEKTVCKGTRSGLYDQNDFDGNVIIGPGADVQYTTNSD